MFWWWICSITRLMFRSEIKLWYDISGEMLSDLVMILLKQWNLKCEYKQQLWRATARERRGIQGWGGRRVMWHESWLPHPWVTKLASMNRCSDHHQSRDRAGHHMAQGRVRGWMVRVVLPTSWQHRTVCRSGTMDQGLTLVTGRVRTQGVTEYQEPVCRQRPAPSQFLTVLIVIDHAQHLGPETWVTAAGNTMTSTFRRSEDLSRVAEYEVQRVKRRKVHPTDPCPSELLSTKMKMCIVLLRKYLTQKSRQEGSHQFLSKMKLLIHLKLRFLPTVRLDNDSENQNQLIR